MSFSKLAAFVFGILFIAILYFIIYYALKIMYKDVKSGGRRKRPMPAQAPARTVNKKQHGLEVVMVEEANNLKVGAVIPVRTTITIGRKDDNSVVLIDQHVSGYHASLIIKNDILYIEDLNSTNGTLVNSKEISGRAKLYKNDEIEIGTTKFKVL